jgi:hypothetical protein
MNSTRGQGRSRNRPAIVIALAAAFAALTAAFAAAAPPILARYTFTQGWATFGIALPEGAARRGIQIGSLPTQTDVKVRWPDGSIRFAVLSARIPAPGAQALTEAQAPLTAFMLPTPAAAVTLTIGGRPFTALLLRPSGDAWLTGPLVWEGRTTVAPGGHPFLRVVFDTRTYAGGGSRVDVTVENCLDTEASDQVTYDADITIGGQRVFRQAGITHKYLARWRKVFLTGGLVESAVTPDVAPFVAAHAIPGYLPDLDAPRREMTGQGVSGSGFGVLAFGDLTVPMNAHSGRPELAPYPDWTAQFLVHKQPSQREYMLRHGDLAGSWGIHVRNPDGSLPTLDTPGHGYYWLDPRWRDPGNRSAGFTGPQGNLEHRAEQGDLAHQPSLAYVPYLITGDRFYADEMAFWANFCLIGSFASDDNRKGPQGLLIGNEVRGIGWGLRNLGDAAAYLPDRLALKGYLASKLWNNLRSLDQYAAGFNSGPVQTLFPGRRPEDGTAPYESYLWISLWEQSYLAWAVDHVMQHGRVASFNLADAGGGIRNRIARLQLQLFTNPQWPKAQDRQAPYLLAAGRWTAGSPRTPAFFDSFSAMAAATFSVPSAERPDFVRPFEGYYGPEARLLLMICARLGDTGASKSLAALMAHASEGVRMIDDLHTRSGWAIAP